MVCSTLLNNVWIDLCRVAMYYDVWSGPIPSTGSVSADNDLGMCVPYLFAEGMETLVCNAALFGRNEHVRM